MKIAQIRHNSVLTAAVLEEEGYRLISGRSTASLINEAEATQSTLAEVAGKSVGEEVVKAEPAIPVTPSEVWACGCTYAPSAEFRDGEIGTREGMYAYVHKPENRPEIFFKGLARHCVGPNEKIGIREDSKFTAPEPEFGIVVDSMGTIHGYTLGNDVSAWDIERENALYLPQSKVYAACCSLGPVIVTPDEIDDPYALDMSCTIARGAKTTFSGSVSTDKLRRKLEDLVAYLMRSNPIPTATVILTGTGIIVTEEAALHPGDVTTITIPEFGSLSNPAAKV